MKQGGHQGPLVVVVYSPEPGSHCPAPTSRNKYGCSMKQGDHQGPLVAVVYSPEPGSHCRGPTSDNECDCSMKQGVIAAPCCLLLFFEPQPGQCLDPPPLLGGKPARQYLLLLLGPIKGGQRGELGQIACQLLLEPLLTLFQLM